MTPPAEDWRARLLATMRAAIPEAVAADGVVVAHERMYLAMDVVMQEFRIAHDIPDARYLYNPDTGLCFSGGPCQAIPTHHLKVNGPTGRASERLTRQEFLRRIGDTSL